MASKIVVPLALIVMSGLAFANAPPKKKAAAHPVAAQHAAALPASALRDWSQIDTNRDHLVSPEEMEKYLAGNPGPLKKS